MEYISEGIKESNKSLLYEWDEAIIKLNLEDYFNLEEFQKLMVRTWKVISANPTCRISTSLMILMCRFSGIIVNKENSAASNLVSEILYQYIFESGIHEENGFLILDSYADQEGNCIAIDVNTFDIRSIIDELSC